MSPNRPIYGCICCKCVILNNFRFYLAYIKANPWKVPIMSTNRLKSGDIRCKCTFLKIFSFLLWVLFFGLRFFVQDNHLRSCMAPCAWIKTLKVWKLEMIYNLTTNTRHATKTTQILTNSRFSCESRVFLGPLFLDKYEIFLSGRWIRD